MILHPGFLKTGTKTLQHHLFGVHPGLWSIGYPHTSPLFARLSEELRRIDGVDYDAAETRRLLAEATERCPPGRTLVLSDETLTADVALLRPVAERLHAFFPEATVLFTIRHQLDSIRSFYARHGRVLTNAPAPYADRFVPLPAWIDHAYRNRPTSFLGMIDYDRTIRLYEDVFGRDRIRVLLFETLRDDPPAYAAALAGVLGVDAAGAAAMLAGRHLHAREAARFVRYDRFVKRWIPKPWLRALLPHTAALRRLTRRVLAGGAPFEVVLPPEWVPRLQALYHAGNRALAGRYALPLDRYDYP